MFGSPRLDSQIANIWYIAQAVVVLLTSFPPHSPQKWRIERSLGLLKRNEGHGCPWDVANSLLSRGQQVTKPVPGHAPILNATNKCTLPLLPHVLIWVSNYNTMS